MDEQNYIKNLENTFSKVPKTLDSWMDAEKKTSFKKFLKNGLPTKKLESWKFTDVNNILNKKKFQPFIKKEDEKKINIKNNQFYQKNSITIIFNNGSVNIKKNFSKDLEVSSILESFKLKSKETKKLIKKHNVERTDSILDLNNAFLNDGIIIKIKKGVKLDNPISIFFYNSKKLKDILINNRVYILLEEEAEAEIVEIFLSDENASYWNNIHTFIELKEKSKLNHYKIQLESSESVHFSSTNLDCKKSSIYNGFLLSLGGLVSRMETTGSINESKIECNVKGLYIGKKSQVHDITNLIQHKHAESKSNQYIKGIVENTAKGIFQGKVKVFQDAQKTNAYQFNQNLLLSENAEVNTKPELEIYADDVKCSHGVTTGELDKEMLFYLRSRGLTLDESRNLLIEGFVNELMEDIKNKEIKRKLLITSKNWLKKELK